MEGHQFGSRLGELALPKHLYFEGRARLGRLLSAKRRVPRKSLLQIGSGLNPLPDFENVDFYFHHRGQAKHVGHDLRKPLPYADNNFDGAYSEHTLEHMYPADALHLLRQLARVLKPGAVFRCSVPDLSKYIGYYNGAPSNSGFEMFQSGCEAIWNLTQNHLHHSVWDAPMLKQKMLESGFSSAEEYQFRDGPDPRLLVDQEMRKWESLYVEGKK